MLLHGKLLFDFNKVFGFIIIILFSEVRQTRKTAPTMLDEIDLADPPATCYGILYFFNLVEILTKIYRIYSHMSQEILDNI